MNPLLLGNYAPRCCGIATFTQDLRSALQQTPEADVPVAMVSDSPTGYEYPREVRHVLGQHDRADYRRLGRALNGSGHQVLCLQHEYGIYGGPSGSWLLDLLDEVTFPVVTTCHTVLEHPSFEERHVMNRLAKHSARLVVMTEKGRELLHRVHGVPKEKIAVIPHGIPDLHMSDETIDELRRQMGWNGRRIMLTFGLLSPNKGIENAIRALPAIVERHPDLLYVVVGATHPNLVREQGEAYRESLQALARELGVEAHLAFVNRFVSREELVRLIGAADIYVTPYLHEAQITSGTLAYAFGLGKPVISTPYWHAAELLANDHGRIVPFRDSAAIAAAANELLGDDATRQRIAQRAFERGRDMVWPAVGRAYLELFRQVAAEHQTPRALPAEPREKSDVTPMPRLTQVGQLFGPLGMYQHAKYAEPDLAHGYCVDDNARAVIALSDFMRFGGRASTSAELLRRGFQFLLEAYNPANGRYRNFRHTEGHWLEEAGSSDSQGRVFWALGHLSSHAPFPLMRAVAADWFAQDLRTPLGFQSPRTWAFVLLGLAAYRKTHPVHAPARAVQSELAGRLMALFERNGEPGWDWCEEVVTYDNARLCEALILTAAQTHEDAMLQTGLRTLQWLLRQQTSGSGYFVPIGCHGFFRKGDAAPARFDQQPLEATAMVAACLAAWRATQDATWLDHATQAHAWFLGENDLGVPVADLGTGGCHDGLQQHGLNLNQGAESVLAFVHSALLLRQAQLEAAGELVVPARPRGVVIPVAKVA